MKNATIEMSTDGTANLMRLNGVNVYFTHWRWDDHHGVYILSLDGKHIGHVGKKMTDWFASYVEDK